MIKKKIAMLGMWGVGKTSLVRRYVHSNYHEKYQSTLGVTLEKKIVTVQAEPIQLVLWDIAGAEENFSVPLHYVTGAAGYLLVIDGTRRSSLDCAMELHEKVQTGVGVLPFVTVVNKCDLSWDIHKTELESCLGALGGDIFYTSAKTGEQVEDAFMRLAEALSI